MDESTHSNQSVLRQYVEQREVDSALDHLHVLFSAEEKFYPCCQDYISGSHLLPSEASDRMNESWRRKLCEWMYQVVDHFGFDREVSVKGFIQNQSCDSSANCTMMMLTFFRFDFSKIQSFMCIGCCDRSELPRPVSRISQ